jgi:hypothetical protein
MTSQEYIKILVDMVGRGLPRKENRGTPLMKSFPLSHRIYNWSLTDLCLEKGAGGKRKTNGKEPHDRALGVNMMLVGLLGAPH